MIPEYRYELARTRPGGTHAYTVFLPTGERLGQVQSLWVGKKKRWVINDIAYKPSNIIRDFAKRTDVANILWAYYRDNQKAGA